MDKYKIEFNDDTTLEGLLESFKNLEEAGICGYIEINGKKVYGTDLNLEMKLTEIFESRVTKKKKIKKKSDKDYTVNDAIHKMDSCWNLSNNEVFKYYLGVSLKYTKQEFRDGLKKYYIDVYSNDKYKCLRDIHLFANILVILEYKDIIVIHEKLNLFFLNISQDDAEKLDLLLNNIERYAINGDLVEQCFCRDILDEDVKRTREEAFALTRKK